MSLHRAFLSGLLALGCSQGASQVPLDPPPAGTNPIEIELLLPSPARASRRDLAGIALRLTNTSPAPIRILAPGDGSSAARRSPIIAWSVLPASSDADHAAVPVDGVLGCGNINPLQASEVHELAPGASLTIDTWLSPPRLAPGDHRLVIYYENDPDLEFLGLPLGPHDPDALAFLRGSTPCAAWSPEVVVTITE